MKGCLAAIAHGRFWHIAAPDVCDGTSAVGESRHRIPGASVGQATEPCLVEGGVGLPGSAGLVAARSIVRP